MIIALSSICHFGPAMPGSDHRLGGSALRYRGIPHLPARLPAARRGGEPMIYRGVSYVRAQPSVGPAPAHGQRRYRGAVY